MVQLQLHRLADELQSSNEDNKRLRKELRAAKGEAKDLKAQLDRSKQQAGGRPTSALLEVKLPVSGHA